MAMKIPFMQSIQNPVLVLAAGDQTRWNAQKIDGVPEIKQLCTINGETLIERIERQFNSPIVFTNNETLKEHCNRPYPVEDNLTTISTLFSTRAHWRDSATILLGDVMYSRAMVRRLWRQTDDIMFYGNNAEIFALKFKRSVRERLAKTIQDLVSHPNWTPQYGKLWNLYRAIIGVPFDRHYIGKAFTYVSDCRDFDTKDEYIHFIRK
jgi:hypothetical protein